VARFLRNRTRIAGNNDAGSDRFELFNSTLKSGATCFKAIDRPMPRQPAVISAVFPMNCLAVIQLGDEFLDQSSVHVRKPEIAPGMEIGQQGVIQAHQVEACGM
jgi:hypothetical protein